MDSGAVARDRQQVQEAGSSCKRQGQEAVCRSRDRKQAVKEVYSSNNNVKKTTVEMSLENLIVYQKAYKLAMMVFEITKRFPAEEKYSLTDR